MTLAKPTTKKGAPPLEIGQVSEAKKGKRSAR